MVECHEIVKNVLIQIEDFFQGLLIVKEQIWCEFIKKKKTALKTGLLYLGIKSIKIMKNLQDWIKMLFDDKISKFY